MASTGLDRGDAPAGQPDHPARSPHEPRCPGSTRRLLHSLRSVAYIATAVIYGIVCVAAVVWQLVEWLD